MPAAASQRVESHPVVAGQTDVPSA